MPLVSRLLFLLIACACATLVGAAVWLAAYYFLTPCPLCMFQRGAFMLTGVFALLAALHGRWVRLHGLLVALAALLGAALAGRQILLQYFPDPAAPPAHCGGDFFYLMNRFPLSEVIVQTLKGTGDCAVIDWTWWGLSLAVWSFLAFLCFALCAGWIVWRGTLRAH